MLDHWKFMEHNMWENVLMLHWRVPKLGPLGVDLEAIMQSQTAFTIDRYDGSYWIGLVLLTERGVGPGIPMARKVFPNVDHHGINVRTYCHDDGVYFYSLECDSRLATVGANNAAGIPYKLSCMRRDFECSVNGGETTYSVHSERAGYLDRRRLHQEVFRGAPELAFKGPMAKRLQHSQEVDARDEKLVDARDDKLPAGTTAAEDFAESQRFGVSCKWGSVDDGSSSTTDAANREWEKKANFFMERYAVYSKHVGIKLRGSITHEEWPKYKVKVEELKIRNVEDYAPAGMCPIVQLMQSNPPDHMVFSPGVGPVKFNWLKPHSVPASEESK